MQVPSTFGLPSSDFTYSATTIDTSSDPLGFPNPSPYARPYRDGDRHSPGFDYKLHSKASSRLGSRRDEPRRPDQSTRERSRRSSDSEGSSSSEVVAFADNGSGQVGRRERLSFTLSPSNCGPGSSVFVSKREQLSFFFLVSFWYLFRPPRSPSLASMVLWFQNVEQVLALGVCLPTPLTSSDRLLAFHPKPLLLPRPYAYDGFSRHTLPRFVA